MNTEEKWILETQYPIPRQRFATDDAWHKYRKQLELGDELVDTVKALRELNHDQFQSLGKLHGYENRFDGIIRILNTPNTTDHWAIVEIINLLGLEMDQQKGWVKNE